MRPAVKPFKIAGKNLANIRVQKGITQERAAEKIGVGIKFYQAIEGGSKAPSYLTLCKIRRALDTTWEELLAGC